MRRDPSCQPLGALPACPGRREAAGTRRGVARAVAVAVNGRIAATARTFHLLGGGGEQFAVLVPDWLFLPGRNRVAVYAIASRHGRLRLRLLGGA